MMIHNVMCYSTLCYNIHVGCNSKKDYKGSCLGAVQQNHQQAYKHMQGTTALPYCCDLFVMSLLRSLKPVDGLPDPRGEMSARISSRISSQVIAEANKEVQQAINDTMIPKQRGSYMNYTPSQRAEIAKYAGQHGAAAAAQHFSNKLKKHRLAVDVL